LTVVLFPELFMRDSHVLARSSEYKIIYLFHGYKPRNEQYNLAVMFGNRQRRGTSRAAGAPVSSSACPISLGIFVGAFAATTSAATVLSFEKVEGSTMTRFRDQARVLRRGKHDRAAIFAVADDRKAPLTGL
jgi:hypothetical protein